MSSLLRRNLYLLILLLSFGRDAYAQDKEQQEAPIVFVSKQKTFAVIEGGKNAGLTRNEIVCFFLNEPKKTLCMRVVAANRSKSAVLFPKSRSKDFKFGESAARITLVKKSDQPDETKNTELQDSSPAPAEDTSAEANNPEEQVVMAEAPELPIPPELPEQPTEEEQPLVDMLAADENQAADPDGTAAEETSEESKKEETKPEKKSPSKAQSKAKPRPKKKSSSNFFPGSKKRIGIGLSYEPTADNSFTFNRLGFTPLPNDPSGVKSLWSQNGAIQREGAISGELSFPFFFGSTVHTGVRLDDYTAKIVEDRYSSSFFTAFTETKIATESWGLFLTTKLPVYGRKGFAASFVAGTDFTLANITVSSSRIEGASKVALASAQSRLGVLSLKLGPSISYELFGVGLDLSFLRSQPLVSVLKRYTANVTRPDGVNSELDLEEDLQTSLNHSDQAYQGALLTVSFFPSTILDSF